MSLIERRLAEECNRYGLPHDLDALLKHVYANRDLSLAFKDQSIETLTEQLRGAVADERTRWVRLILQADELQDPAGALAALVNMARVEHDRPGGQ